MLYCKTIESLYFRNGQNLPYFWMEGKERIEKELGYVEFNKPYLDYLFIYYFFNGEEGEGFERI